jgi:Flp pilus assembly protein CpaB
MTVDHRFRNIVIAAVLAAAAALLTVVYVSTARDEAAAQSEDVTVYVATKTFPIGTAGSKIAGSLEKRTVTRSSMTPKAVASPAEIKDLYTTETVYSGEQLSLNRFVPPKQVGVLSMLTGKERAVQVAGDETQMLDGTLQPGDRVDVVANLKNPRDQADIRSLVILRDLRVLQTQDGEGATINDPDNNKSLAILAMTSEQAQRFAWTRFNSNEQWWLQLRPVKKPKDGQADPATFQTVVGGGR